MTDQIEIQKAADGLIRIRGELSYVNVSDVHQRAVNFFKNQNDVKIDLGGVTHSDSAGIALLVEWLSDARHRNQVIHFVNLPKQMLKMVRVSNLDQVLPIV